MAKTLYELLETRYDVKSTGKVKTVEITETLPATEVAQLNPNRSGLLFSNTSTAIIYLSLEKAMGLTDGIILTPSGGSFSVNWFEDFYITGWSWYAVANAAGGKLTVVESIITG
jgi:hypothetical protein